MPKGSRRKQRVYPPEFRQQLIELVRAGRTPEELSREFEPSGQTIRNWAGTGPEVLQSVPKPPE
jgi:transposase-like protein